MSLWPSNSAQTISFGGYTKLAHKTQVTGFFSYGLWSNDEPLQPFTINSALPTIALPRDQRGGRSARVLDQPEPDVAPRRRTGGSARACAITPTTIRCRRRSITQFVNYDSSVSTTPTGGPDLYAHNRTHVRRRRDVGQAEAARADRRLHAQRQRLRRADLRVERRGRVPRVGRRGGLLVGSPSACNTRSAAAPDRASTRQLLTDIGEQPEMRHYDLADRTRNRFTAQVDIVPSDVWMFSVSGGLLQRRLRRHATSDCRSRTGNTFSLAADYHRPNGLGAGATYNFERYTGLQQSHEGDSSDAQFNDPLRNWTSDSTETVHYFSIYATPPRIGRNTEVRFSYDFSHARRRQPLHDSGGQPDSAAQSAAGGVQQAAAAAHRRAAPAHEQPRGDVLVSLRAVAHLRLRVRSRAWSTASSSPARWSWATSIGRTPRTRSMFGLRYLW